MEFSTTLGPVNMETTFFLMFGLILVATAMKAEATPALEKIAAAGLIEKTQLEKRDATSGK